MQRPILILMVGALALFDGGAAAQDATLAVTVLPRARPFPTPADEAQPTPRDLPPGVAENEGKRTPGQKNFDKHLQICRGC